MLDIKEFSASMLDVTIHFLFLLNSSKLEQGIRMINNDTKWMGYFEYYLTSVLVNLTYTGIS